MPSTSQANVELKQRLHTRTAAAKARRRNKRDNKVQKKRLHQEFSLESVHSKRSIDGRINRMSRRIRRLFVTGLQLSKQAELEVGSLDSATREASRNYLERAYKAAEHVLRLIEYRRRQHSKDNTDNDRPTFSRQELVNHCHLIVYNKPY